MLKPMTGVFARTERARIDVMEGFAYWGDHQVARALQLFERGLADAGPVWGTASANAASVLSAEGSVLLELGNLDEAEARFRRAYDVLLALNGDSHPSLGAMANNLGSVRYHRHDYAGAAGWYRESLAVKERAGLGPGSLGRGYSLINLGESLYQLGQIDEAAASLAEARAIFVAKLGPANELMGELETFEGLIALARGAHDAAVTILEDALARRQATQAAPGDRADTELALARALQAAGRDRARARGLGERARADYVAAGKKDEAVAAATWLEKPARP
jgi:tetratricopeptide (TPR) repeat protein